MAGTSEIFGDGDRERVNQAVREAESSTSAERSVVRGSGDDHCVAGVSAAED